MVEVDQAVLLQMQQTINQLKNDIDDLRQYKDLHGGIDIGQSGLGYPHPYLKTNLIELARIVDGKLLATVIDNINGIQLNVDSTGDIPAIYLGGAPNSIPATTYPHGELYGRISTSLGRADIGLKALGSASVNGSVLVQANTLVSIITLTADYYRWPLRDNTNPSALTNGITWFDTNPLKWRGSYPDGLGGQIIDNFAMEAFVTAAIAAPGSTFALTADISPSQITANQNNYNPTGLSTAAVLRLNSDAARDITGLAGGADGRLILIHNVGSFTLTLKDASGSSDAANQFALPSDWPIAADDSVILQYDSTSSRWRLITAGMAAYAIARGLAAAKGDLLAATAAGSWSALTLGTDGHILTADSAQAAGVKWAAAGASGMMKVSGSGYLVMPAAATGIDPANSGSAWTNGAYSQVLASTSEADYLIGLLWSPENQTTFEAEIDIATGAAASETVVSTIAVFAGSGDATPTYSSVSPIMFPAPIAVATNTRIAVRVRSSSTTLEPKNIKLIYVKQSELVAL